jgi:aspartate 1-decarboxylase
MKGRMLRTLLKSKIHGARVTHADLNYVGSVTIDRDLMEATDLWPNEKVLVVNLDTGARLETYVFEGAAGSGVIGMNGGCARLCQPGDRVLIMAFAAMEDAEARKHRPRVVFTDASNRVEQVLEAR